MVKNYAPTPGGHILREVKIGGIITHEPHSMEPIAWKIGTVSMDLNAADMEAAFEKISRQLRAKVRSFTTKNNQDFDQDFRFTHKIILDGRHLPPQRPTYANGLPDIVSYKQQRSTIYATPVTSS